MVAISALGQLYFPNLAKGGKNIVENRSIPSSEINSAFPEALDVTKVCNLTHHIFIFVFSVKNIHEQLMP